VDARAHLWSQPQYQDVIKGHRVEVKQEHAFRESKKVRFFGFTESVHLWH